MTHDSDAPSRALVTGAGVRVGRTIALALGEAGYDVIVHYHASEGEARETAATIREAGRRASALPSDLSDVEAIEDLFEQVRAELGGLELLVNSAAVFPRTPPAEVTRAEWDEVFAVNTRAPFFCSREAARLMGDRGAIVNVVDVAAFEAWPAYAPYAASKAAVVSLTRSLALAWAPGIRVNAVAPGPVLLPEGAPAEERRAAAERTAVGRIGSPDDVADAVLYLAGASFVTGEVLRVDGGGTLTRGSRQR